MALKIKYLVVPDFMLSKTDNQKHFIGATQLMRLYGVNPLECIVSRDGEIYKLNTDNLIVLRPRYNGDYTLPTESPSHDN